MNAITYKDIFPKILEHKVWFGYKFDSTYDYLLPNGDECTEGGQVWFTNLENNKKEYLELTETYEEGKYHKYDNYDAINVDRIKNIPYDYDGLIGTPISLLKYLSSDGYIYCNNQRFTIIKFRKGNDDKDLKINGKIMYCRCIIQKKDSK